MKRLLIISILFSSINFNCFAQTSDVHQLDKEMKNFRSRMRVYAKCLSGKCTTQERNAAAKAALKDGAIVAGTVLALAGIGVLARIYGPRLMQKPRHEAEALNIGESKIISVSDLPEGWEEGILSVTRTGLRHVTLKLKLYTDEFKEKRHQFDFISHRYPWLQDYSLTLSVALKAAGDSKKGIKPLKITNIVENESGTKQIINESIGPSTGLGNQYFKLIDGQWKEVSPEEFQQ